jgi:hypothetical protein
MCSKRATLIAGSCGRLMPLSDVELSLWADILMAVLIAERFWCLTTRAGIDIALSVRGVNEKSGYRTWSRKCSRSHTFTIVFTLPDSLNRLYLHQPKVVYDTHFKTAWSVIDSFGRDPKWPRAQTGMIAILHTWGQKLNLRPHIHCIIPGGGLTKSRGWVSSKTLGKYLFSVTAMSKVMPNYLLFRITFIINCISISIQGIFMNNFSCFFLL